MSKKKKVIKIQASPAQHDTLPATSISDYHQTYSRHCTQGGKERNINIYDEEHATEEEEKKLYLSQTRCDHACLHIIIRVYYWVTTREVDFDECRFALSDPQMFLSYKFALEQ